MTNEQKKKRLESSSSPAVCPGCGCTIKSDDDLSNVEYVRTKRKTDIFIHTGCMNKVWR